MAAQEERNEIIQHSIPELVKHLTGFDDEDVNTERCIQFALSKIRNHRNLSTNSHEVRRKIEGMQERFRVENCDEYAEYLGRLCNEIVEHPLCKEHYEVDVHWSLLDFLFSLAYKPVSALKKNRGQIEIKHAVDVVENTPKDDKTLWKSVLKEDFIPVQSFGSSDSDLSEWSDTEDVANGSQTLTGGDSFFNSALESSSGSNAKKPEIKLPSGLGNIKSPERTTPFQLFEPSDPEKQLDELIQHSWWNKGERLNAEVESEHEFAHFAEDFSRHLSETSNNLIRFPEPTTIREEHVLREILWMFQVPCTATVFNLNKNGQLAINDNVTIPSCGVNAFRGYLDHHYLPYMNMMAVLTDFHTNIYNFSEQRPPLTLECYATNLKFHLSPIWDAIFKFENRLVTPKDFEINTLISMRTYFNEAFTQLAFLYQLHCEVVLKDWRQHPAHVTSAFLLARLMKCYKEEIDVARGNLCFSLLLTSLKTFCYIIETWWVDGRLEDWLKEFIIERASDTGQAVCMRKYYKDKDKSFFVAANVTSTIEEDSLFKLLKEYSLETGHTLNLLYEIGRIGDLRNNSETLKGGLYQAFVDDVLSRIGSIHANLEQFGDKDDEDEAAGNGDTEPSAKHTTESGEQGSSLNNLRTTDSYLYLAFALNVDEEDKEDAEDGASGVDADEEKPVNALHIYEFLQKSKYCLPLGDIMLSSLSRLLKQRIAYADTFVLKLYNEEFKILTHFQNIRKVLLLEASDVMHQFYTKLFKEIEAGESWANPSLLTMQFDDILCSRYPKMSSLFSIEIKSDFRSRTCKVVDAVDEIIINYSISHEMGHIIFPEDMQAYNKVFCFLLKVKWGITTLENLRFAQSHKRRIPYARFEMIDLIMRRLEQFRFWMIYALESIHFHLMTHVLQSMGEQLDVKIQNCKNLKEVMAVHKSYLNTVCEHCFLGDNGAAIILGVEQLLNLVSILRGEWLSCVKYMQDNNPLAVALDESADTAGGDFVQNSQIDSMEYTYICCHQYMANILNDQVYEKKLMFLSGLKAAFNSSLPH